MIQTPHQQPDQNSVFRATYHPSPQDYYNSQTNQSTGAVPRQSWHGADNKTTPRTYQEDFSQNNSQQISVQIEQTKEQTKDKKSMTKTYHTIKDIISSRFKSNKDSTEEKPEEPGLNNIAEELRRSQRNIGEEQEKKTSGEQNIYGKPRIDQNISHQQHQYNQHVIQQQMLQAQQYQVSQQIKMQQTLYQQQLVQTRSQEMLVARPDEQAYYQNAYGATPQRTGNRFVVPTNREQNYIQMQHHSQVSSPSPILLNCFNTLLYCYSLFLKKKRIDANRLQWNVVVPNKSKEIVSEKVLRHVVPPLNPS